MNNEEKLKHYEALLEDGMIINKNSLKKMVDELSTSNKELQAERERVALLREAVEFYGDWDTWDSVDINLPKDCVLDDVCFKSNTGGLKARQALEKLKELEGEE